MRLICLRKEKSQINQEISQITIAEIVSPQSSSFVLSIIGCHF